MLRRFQTLGLRTGAQQAVQRTLVRSFSAFRPSLPARFVTAENTTSSSAPEVDLQSVVKPKFKEVEEQRVWYLIDGHNQTVGRLAVKIAHLLMGKHKPTYQRHVDGGDFVVVVNADQVHFTGKKWKQKVYRHHTKHPGGLKEIPASRIRDRNPTWILMRAVYGMLPSNDTRKVRMGRLKCVNGPHHTHEPQFQTVLDARHEGEFYDEKDFADIQDGVVYGTLNGQTWEQMDAQTRKQVQEAMEKASKKNKSE